MYPPDAEDEVPSRNTNRVMKIINELIKKITSPDTNTKEMLHDLHAPTPPASRDEARTTVEEEYLKEELDKLKEGFKHNKYI